MIYIYRTLIFILLPLALFLSLFSKKLRSLLIKKDRSLYKPCKEKTLWFHASSGEFEHAKHFIKTIKETKPEQKIIVTYFSPSYLGAIKRFSYIDYYLPLPLDMPFTIHETIKAINPSKVFFASGDVWPELVEQLKRKKIPTTVFTKKQSPESSLLKKLVHSLTFAKVDHISFISQKDLETYSKLYPNNQQTLSADGDPRVDQVIEKRKYGAALNKEKSKTLILGSIWPEDLEIIAKPLQEALEKKLLKKLIVVPHEPSTKNLELILKKFKYFETELYSKDSDLKSQVVVVDTLGKLLNLYNEASFAFIGGSYRKKVHSVLEPLCYGMETLVGPLSKNSFEVRHFSKQDFVHICTDQDAFKKKIDFLLNQETFKKDKILREVSKLSGASEKLLKNL